MFVIREILYDHPVYLERPWPTKVKTHKNPACSGVVKSKWMSQAVRVCARGDLYTKMNRETYGKGIIWEKDQ